MFCCTYLKWTFCSVCRIEIELIFVFWPSWLLPFSKWSVSVQSVLNLAVLYNAYYKTKFESEQCKHFMFQWLFTLWQMCGFVFIVGMFYFDCFWLMHGDSNTARPETVHQLLLNLLNFKSLLLKSQSAINMPCFLFPKSTWLCIPIYWYYIWRWSQNLNKEGKIKSYL